MATRTARTIHGPNWPSTSTGSTRRARRSARTPAVAEPVCVLIRRPSRGRLARLPAGDAGCQRHDPLLGRLGPRQFAGEPALAHDEDAVAHAEDLRQFGGDHQDGDTATGELTHQMVDLRLGADVDAAGWLV